MDVEKDFDSNQDVIVLKNITKHFSKIDQKGIFDVLRNKGPLESKDTQNEITALDDISFTVKKGQVIGIIGLNGGGKTTLLRMISGILQPDSGTIKVTGKISPLLQLGVGFHEELIASENIVMFGMLLGMTKNEIKQKVDKIIEFAGLQQFQLMKLKHYSAGMRVRLAFSTALEIDPDILLVDEVLSVGDEIFRKKSFDAFTSFKKKGKTILYTTHNITIMTRLSDRVLLIHQGKLVMDGEPRTVLEKYKEIIATNTD